ncbi:chorismate mutase [Vulcanibacillus modesticaldus]|uniref:Chorismate mutase n=1 Tax=Vulcanibacillus modesticaldus TaxID=337097 RepID=A0A1D2YUL2_9BACI|nr:chorismate mutase [Vulcanibacillus modesticaldus]OEF99345.1 chorismate mutase [Vulcanibacillus modesticaldus]
MNGLKILRDEIDKLDQDMVEIFEKRIEKVLKIAEYKAENNEPILNENREKEVILKNISRLKNKEYSNYVEELFNTILSISKKIQDKQLNTDTDS